MPVHQCMRNLSWSSSVSFTQVCRSLAVLEVLAPRAQPCCALGSWCPCVGDPPGLSWARLLPSCCGELCLSPQQYIPLHPSMTGEDREVVYTAPPPSEVCLFTSLCCWGKIAEGARHGVWGQIWAEWHLPFERSHSPSCLQDLTPCVAAITSQTWLEWWCSVWAEAYAHSFRLEYSVL